MGQHYDDEFGHGQGVTTTEMAVAKYRKRLMQSCGVGIVLGMIGLYVVERTYMQILLGLWDLELRNWWLAPAIGLIAVPVIYLNRPKRRKQKPKEVIVTNSKSAKGKIGLAAVVVMLFAIVVGVVLAAAVNTLVYPNTATVNQITDIQGYVNDVLWTNNTGIDWGAVDRNVTYSKNFAILNNGNANITDGHLLLIVTGLPAGWSETWNTNDTLINLQPQQSVTSLLVLSVPFDALPGPTNWTMSVSVT